MSLPIPWHLLEPAHARHAVEISATFSAIVTVLLVARLTMRLFAGPPGLCPPHCRRCGSGLRGADDGLPERCPECGRPLATPAAVGWVRSTRRRWLTPLAWIMALAAGSAVWLVVAETLSRDCVMNASFSPIASLDARLARLASTASVTLDPYTEYERMHRSRFGGGASDDLTVFPGEREGEGAMSFAEALVRNPGPRPRAIEEAVRIARANIARPELRERALAVLRALYRPVLFVPGSVERGSRPEVLADRPAIEGIANVFTTVTSGELRSPSGTPWSGAVRSVTPSGLNRVLIDIAPDAPLGAAEIAITWSSSIRLTNGDPPIVIETGEARWSVEVIDAPGGVTDPAETAESAPLAEDDGPLHGAHVRVLILHGRGGERTMRVELDLPRDVVAPRLSGRFELLVDGAFDGRPIPLDPLGSAESDVAVGGVTAEMFSPETVKRLGLGAGDRVVWMNVGVLPASAPEDPGCRLRFTPAPWSDHRSRGLARVGRVVELPVNDVIIVEDPLRTSNPFPWGSTTRASEQLPDPARYATLRHLVGW